MIAYLLRRLLFTLPVVLGVCTLTFLLIHFVPGDPVDVILGDQASAIDKEALRKSLGLDQPLPEQYASFMGGLTHFDLGRSLHSKKPVSTEIAERIPATAELAITALMLAVLIGIPLGVVAAIRQFRPTDYSVMLISLWGMSIPGIFLGPLLIWIFAIKLDLFPVSDRNGLISLVLPAVSLAIPLSAVLMRLTRASMLEVINEDYIRTARSKGLDNPVVFFKHALSNALIPIITVVGLQVGALLTGTVITETIFDWPGLGTLLLGSIQRRDYPVVQGCILLISLTYVFVNLFTDLAYGIVNPKVRNSYE
ncbi:MAG: ABC transporter permease [Bdellovibrionales bacterium]|nr:ABC transporter permease [Bdellovibrionales bacterium]